MSGQNALTRRFRRPSCTGGFWTKYFDRDSPGGRGDYETLIDIFKKNPGKVCLKPIAVYARVKSSKQDYRIVKQVVEINTKTGFICRNAQQPYGTKCLDYEVQFCCRS